MEWNWKCPNCIYYRLGYTCLFNACIYKTRELSTTNITRDAQDNQTTNTK